MPHLAPSRSFPLLGVQEMLLAHGPPLLDDRQLRGHAKPPLLHSHGGRRVCSLGDQLCAHCMELSRAGQEQFDVIRSRKAMEQCKEFMKRSMTGGETRLHLP